MDNNMECTPKKRNFERNQIAAIETSISIGRELATNHPEIKDLHREQSYAQIAKIYRDNGIASHIRDPIIWEHAVGYALRGNNDSRFGKCYTGLLEDEQIKSNVKVHRQKGIIQARAYTVANPSLERKKIFAETAIKLAIQKGQTPWELGETWFALALSREYCSQDIALILNHYLHKKPEVRTKITVNGLFRRKRVKEEQEFPKSEHSFFNNEEPIQKTTSNHGLPDFLKSFNSSSSR